jgi:hypothetical protein
MRCRGKISLDLLKGAKKGIDKTLEYPIIRLQPIKRLGTNQIVVMNGM